MTSYTNGNIQRDRQADNRQIQHNYQHKQLGLYKS